MDHSERSYALLVEDLKLQEIKRENGDARDD